MPSVAAEPQPTLTAGLPGVGGVVKQRPEDFEVEELPAYEPGGDGEHLFLWIEKRDVSAEELQRHLSRTLGIGRGEIGTAGLKDRRAITRQYVSVPARCEPRVDGVNSDSIRVLQARRHRNKLRTGHLKGNRFSVLLREATANAVERAQAKVDRLAPSGFPNYYGEQRFGRECETLQTGMDLLAGRTTPRDLPPARRKFLLRLSLSAVQSGLFNRVLAARLAAGRLEQIEAGDVLQVTASGGLFLAEDVPRDQRRFATGEIVPTGPLFGPKMREPFGAPAQLEQVVLEEFGLDRAAFGKFPKLTAGGRRPLLVRPQDLSVAGEPDGLRLQVTLPPGSYATVLLREFCPGSRS
ncbi:MAG: tRNA pseudouridine(13) synthase TruD [Planctomycetes bacterium]|nr:tRNA pseudouridine(13) synthase TruD [Planctomycetota bacterium]